MCTVVKTQRQNRLYNSLCTSLFIPRAQAVLNLQQGQLGPDSKPKIQGLKIKSEKREGKKKNTKKEGDNF